MTKELPKLGLSLAAFLLFSVLLRCVYGDFTVKPQRTILVRKGATATFIWDYSTPVGTTALISVWCKINPLTGLCPKVPIMKKVPSDPVPVVRQDNTEYASRTTGSLPATMLIRDIRLTDDGKYSMAVTFSNGDTISDRVNLVVLVNPVITKRTQENKITVTEGQKRTLDCGASIGNPKPLRMEWWFNNVIVLKKQSNFELPLVFNSTKRYERGKYKCMVSNIAGSTSYTVELNVVFAPENVQIIPSSSGVVNVQEGGNVTLLCQSQGYPNPTFAWIRIRPLYREVVKKSSYDPKYVLKRIDKSLADNYECQAENEVGKKAQNVYLNVQYRPERMNFSINDQNTSLVYVNKGMSANMTCTTMSSPEASYRIGFEGSAVAKVTEKTYFIKSAVELDDGVYECIASNGIGLPVRASIRMIVVVPPREITIRGNPSKQVLNSNTQLSLRCEMKGHPQPSIYWTLNQQQLTFDKRRTNVNGSLPGIGQEKIYYSDVFFRPLSRFDNGEFKCFGQNWGGVVEMKYYINVQYAPYIIVAPKNVTIREFQSAELTCRAIGKPALSHYIWKQNDIVRTSDAGERIYFPRASRADGGRYTCAGINSVDTGVAAVAYLTVTYLPEFTVVPPVSQIFNTSMKVILNCNATGVPKPRILWTKDGDTKVLHTGEVLMLLDIGYKQKGIYYCKASNSIGNVSTPSILLINHVPVITSKDPSATKVGSDVGGNAPPVKLVCAVDSYPAAVIKWLKGSAPIEKNTIGYEVDDTSKAGTSVLTVIMSDDSKRGSYKCIATNRLGTTQQKYDILKKSLPDPPVRDSLKAKDTLELTDPATVTVEISWTPGYNGGFPVTFYLYYKIVGSPSFEQVSIGAASYNVHRLPGLKTATTYQFTMRAVNARGQSEEYEPYLEYRTQVAPPKRGGASCRRYGTLGTQVQVSWNVNNYIRARSIIIRYRRVIDIGWKEVAVPSSKLNDSSYIVGSLDGERMYEFQVFIIYKDGSRGLPISAGQVSPGVITDPEARTGLSKQDIIAIVVGIGGFLLIVIVVCTLYLLRRKKKKHRPDGNFEMKTNSGGRGNTRGGVVGYSTVGSDVVRTGLSAEQADDFHPDDDDDDDEDDALVTDSLNNEKTRKDSPPPYNDHFSYYDDGTEIPPTSYNPPRNPLGNTPAYSSFSALANQKRSAIADPEPVRKADSRTSLVSGRAAEISRKNRTPFDYEYERDERGNRYHDVDDEREPDRNRYQYGTRDRDKYRYPPPPLDQKPKAKGSSSGGISTDDDLPSPPPFMREALTNMHSDSERAPGSMGERMGRNKNTLRSSPQHSPSSQRSGVSSNQYRSDTEHIDDDEDNYVGYLV